MISPSVFNLKMPQSILQKLWLFKDNTKPNSLSEFKRLSKEKKMTKAVIDFISLNMIIKVHRLGMGNSMVIKTDEIKAEIVNYIKQNK